MNYPRIINCNEEQWDKILTTLHKYLTTKMRVHGMISLIPIMKLHINQTLTKKCIIGTK